MRFSPDTYSSTDNKVKMKNISLNVVHKTLLAAIMMIVTGTKVTAQQDPQFSHYMYNTVTVNPAYAGSAGVLNILGLHRSQWIGLDGAPTSQSISINSPLKNKKMGLGFSVINDRIGPLNQTFIYADYSYSIRLTERLKLSFGMKAGINWFQPKIAGLSTVQSSDPSYTGSTIESVIKPNVGAGLYLHRKDWYVGVSSPRLIENRFSLGKTNSDTTSLIEVRHLFFIAGVVIPISSQLKIKPALQTKATINSPLSIDATLEAYVREKFSIGGGWRVNDSFYGMVGYRFNSQLSAGFAYDFTTTRLQNVNNGTVEIMLNYDFIFNNNKLRSPRYF